MHFIAGGASVEQVREFLREALEAGRCREATVESGNKYGVSVCVYVAVDGVARTLKRGWLKQRLCSSTVAAGSTPS